MENKYLEKVYKELEIKNKGEKEFLQASLEILESLEPYINKHPEFEKNGLIERFTEPERIITFRVPWVDDLGNVHVNRGYRVEFNSAIGPYKGGLRFHESVNLSIMKFLAFEQTLKNSLTNLPMGGGKGGSDFNPKGKSDNEIMRFCQSFMNELYRYIGPNTDVPAGDIGVGAREIGYLFGQYKKIKNEYSGVLTGKGLSYGGSLVRTEATGYGLCYYTNKMLETFNKGTFENKKVIISGSGNVALYALKKAIELKATVIAMSDSDGYIYNEEGISFEILKEIKEENRLRISEYVKKSPKTIYVNNPKAMWNHKCDIALPCATQNEIDLNIAKTLVANGVIAVGEGANMPCTLEATKYFIASHILYAPAKAANAGGVLVSGLEMSQNSMRLMWDYEEVDQRLKMQMEKIFTEVYKNSKEYGDIYDSVKGANISGFIKVSQAMMAQGIC